MFAVTALVPLVILAQGWKTHTIADGLSMTLPSPPITMDVKIEDNPGANTWASIHPDGSSIIIGYFPIQPSQKEMPRDELMAAFLSGHLEGDIELVKQRDIALNGWPGLEYVTKEEDTPVLSRLYVTGKSMYYVAVTSETEKGIAPIAQKIFASLKFPSSMAKGPELKPGPTFTPFSLSDSVKIGFPKEPKKEKIPMPENELKLVMDRSSTSYGNRVFAAGVVQIPDDKMDEVASESLAPILGSVNEELVTSLKGKPLVTRSYKLGGVEVMSQTFLSGDKFLWGRVDTFLHGKRVYTVFTFLPAAAKAGPEVEEFFKSIQISEAPPVR
ncbi:MAG: hypothetical protein ACAH95_15140 [Fimbriimonas sp.]